MKDKQGWVGSTKFSETSPCRKLGIVEPLASPSMKTDKGRFNSTRFSEAFFPFVFDIMIYVCGAPCVIQMKDKQGRVGSTKLFETSPCRKLGVVEPLSVPY